LNGTEGFSTVLNIPVMLDDIDYQGSSPLCTQNSVIAQIPQRIPIPRPLSKSNGSVIGHFVGTIADQLPQSQDTPTTAKWHFPMALTTATLSGDQLQQTVLDDSTFGGPGGDLTDIQNENWLIRGYQRVNMERQSSRGAVNVKEVGNIMVVTFLLYLLLMS
jgi:hypothetical protein